jgi:hypothetical protein
MKASRLFPLALCLAAPLHADIHLQGALRNDGKDLVFLWDSFAGTKPEWVTVGATFHGWTVKSYHAGQDSIQLQKGETILEAKLFSTPARIPPRRSEARTVVIKDQIRCCALHGDSLVEAPGFVTGPEILCQLPIMEIRLATMRFAAEFPNYFGWSVSKQRSESRRIEILNEFCPACDAAFERRVALLRLDPYAK